jgi:hypothetical protein
MTLKSSFLTLSGSTLLNLGFYFIASHLKRQVALLNLALSSPSFDVAGLARLFIGLQSLAGVSLLTLVSSYLLFRFGVFLLLLGCSGRGRL